MDPSPPRVFISYSHDSEAHSAHVLELAQRLRGDGVDARLDRFVTSPSEGWARWMSAEIDAASRVVMVCTPTYRRRCEGREEAGVGKGVSFEGLILLQHLYDEGGRTRKLIPVLYAGADPMAAIPPPLRPFSRHVLDAEYDALLRELLGAPAVEPAPIGPIRRITCPPQAVRSEGIDEVLITPESALYQLLLSLFGADELRQWLRFDIEAAVIVPELPGSTASASELVGKVVDRLVEHGLVGPGLFARLRNARLRRAAEIDHVAAHWQGEVAVAPRVAVQATSTSTPERSGPIFNIGKVGGDVVTGDKNEVHHHYGDRRGRRKK